MSLTGALDPPATGATERASAPVPVPVGARSGEQVRSAHPAWAVLAAAAALVPLAQGITASRIFYVRDLSLYFWGRYLWLRRALLSGSWPLWDPYVGAGQSAVADALHQMFLLPALALRLAGPEVLGFNLWVLAPFPLAAWGTWLFFARRFSGRSAMLGAVAYALCGPIISTGDFPNMSWSVAALPWVLWTADRLMASFAPRRIAALAIATAAQALAGEPVTLLSTILLTGAYAACHGTKESSTERETEGANRPLLVDRLRALVMTGVGMGLGLLVAAVQLLPLAVAASGSERSVGLGEYFWSLHPLALLETISLHIFGDYYTSQSLKAVPWMPALNTGREPFFFSLYFGVPLLALGVFGGLCRDQWRWMRFWLVSGAVGLVGAFGAYTPIYPFVQQHLPLFHSFRFPVKYLVVSSFAVAAAAAAGLDALEQQSWRRVPRSRVIAASVAFTIGAAAYLAAAASLYFATPTAFKLLTLAKSIDVEDPIAASAFMLRTLPGAATSVLLLSVAAAALLLWGSSPHRMAPAARSALFALVLVDLIVRAWGVNPTFDAAYLRQPSWISAISSAPDARFYVGGKRDGTLDATDQDAPRGYLNTPGLMGSASRAALSDQAAFYPSAWHAREMLSYDLPVLWPRTFGFATDLFLDSRPAERDRFLRRTGVRYRVLPRRLAAGHTPIVDVPSFYESSLFDFGEDVIPRVSVVPAAQVVPDPSKQIQALFKGDWNTRETVLVDRDATAAGTPGTPAAGAARIVADAANRVSVEADAPAAGGYLLLLDSYSDDWTAIVDGRTAPLLRADGLFRAIKLVPGHHIVSFVFRPRAFLYGAALSTGGLVAVLLLVVLRARKFVAEPS